MFANIMNNIINNIDLSMERSLGAMIKLLPFDLVVTDLNHRNNLTMQDKIAYNTPNVIWPFPRIPHW